MEQNSGTGQHVAGPSGVGGNQNGGGYVYEEAAAFAAGTAAVNAVFGASTAAGDVVSGRGGRDGAAGNGVVVAAAGGQVSAGGPAAASAGGVVGGAAGAGSSRSRRRKKPSAGCVVGGAAGAGPSSLSRRMKKPEKHRHSPQQIRAMKAYFKNCPHPSETQRIELARTLGLDPSQIKCWFQNNHTQLKTKSKREENDILGSGIDDLGATIKQGREDLRSKPCLSCSASDRLSMEENKLRSENINLKEEIAKFKSQAARSMTASSLPNVPTLNGSRHSIIELAVSAAKEVKMMVLAGEPLWISGSADGANSVLNKVEYHARFTNDFGPTKFDTCEASRHIDNVLMNPRQLLHVLLDVNEWSYMFSPIVARALTMDVLSTGEDYNGTLQVMAAEYQIPTPLVPTRGACFARYCTKDSDGVWVVDVSVDNILRAPEIVTCQKKPSGCLIQEMADGSSKITWIEHVYVDYNGVSNMYQHSLLSGLGFGARGWVSTLQRQCQRLATTNNLDIPSIHDFNHLLMSSSEGKRSILKLSERMVNNFYLGITGPKASKWTKLCNFESNIRLMTRRVVDDPGLPTGTLLSVATSFALPAVVPIMVFEYLRDHQCRKEWCMFANGNNYEPMLYTSYGQEARNCVSIYKVQGGNQSHMRVLQESWSDPIASHIVFAPTDIETINLVLSGSDPNSIPILPIGLTILPDGPSFREEGSCGTLLTMSVQVLMERSSMADINIGAATKVAELLRRSCQNIKHALVEGVPDT